MRTIRFATIAIILASGFAIGFSRNPAKAGMLTWDASGANPAHPTQGNGNWDTTSRNWSNATADSGWVNGSAAQFGALNTNNSYIVTIDDPSGTVSVAGMTFGQQTNFSIGLNHYTIAAAANDSLTLTNPNVNAGYYTVVSAPVAGTVGLTLTGGLTLAGQNTYTGPTTLTPPVVTGNQTAFSGLTLLNGATLSNTAVSGNGYFNLTGNATMGSTGPGSQGASLNVSSIGLGSAGTVLTINDQQSFSGPSLVVNNTTIGFTMGPNQTSSELVVNGGRASVSGSQTVNFGVDSSLNPGDSLVGNYTFISDPAGGLSSPGGFGDYGTLTYGSYRYDWKITDTDTTVTLNVTDPVFVPFPDPASLSVIALVHCHTMILG